MRILAEDEESEIDVRDVFITPPEGNDLTDEDSADEDEGGLIDNLTGGQLRAEAEIRLSSNERIGVEDYIDEPKKLLKRKWVEGDMQCAGNFPSVSDYSAYSKLSCVELFELFIDEDLIEHLVAETEKYASFLNCPNPNITSEEIKAFIGILIVSGYNNLPGKKYYWDTKKDVHNGLVSGAMRRDRFIQIMRFLHIADNNLIEKSDKFFKVRPMVEKIKQKCLQHFVPCEFLDYDEAMIKYYGKHSCKQFIKGKPIRFGYKAWCLNTDFGYLVNFDLYQGRNPFGNSAYEKAFGKATAPLLTMIDHIPKKDLPYSIFFDNLFTGMYIKNFFQCHLLKVKVLNVNTFRNEFAGIFKKMWLPRNGDH
jgi:DNA excision repair protein ERCC-6